MNDLNVAIVDTGGIFHYLEHVGTVAGMAAFLVDVTRRHQKYNFDGTAKRGSQGS